jgi:hypothetical protein
MPVVGGCLTRKKTQGLRFKVWGYMGVPTKIGFLFWGFNVTYPPIFEGSESNGAIKFPYTITIWKIWVV